MDNREPGRSSSSPNGSARIETLDRRGAGGRGYEVSLEDGSSFFIVRELWEPVGLGPGEWCDRREIEELASRSRVIIARERAYRLLARREHSAAQLSRKLRQKGADADTAELIVEELQEAGYLSDRRFAENWIETRLRRNPAGARALRAGLAERGVPREIAEEAVGNVRERFPEVFEGAADRALERIMRRSRDRDPRRLSEKLGRRGFSPSEVRSALERAGLEAF